MRTTPPTGTNGDEPTAGPTLGPAPKHKPRHRRRRWIKRGVFGVLALLVLGIGGALIFIHTDRGRQVVRGIVEQRLQGMFTGGATLGRIEGSPFGELRIRDLVINGPDRKPAITVGTLTVELGILPLLSKQARVGTVIAEDVDVDLRRDANGELEISRLMIPGPSSGWSVSLPLVQLRRAHVRFDAGSEVMNFDGLELDARAKIPYGGPLDASLGLRAAWRERAGAPLALDTVISQNELGFAMPYLRVRAGDVHVIGNHVTVTSSTSGRAPVIGGVVMVDAAADAVARLVPAIALPGDVNATVVALPARGAAAPEPRPMVPPLLKSIEPLLAPVEVEPPGARWTELAMIGTLDGAPVRMTGMVDLDALHAHGELSTGELDVTKLSAGKVEGRGSATVTFDARPGGPNALPVATATIRGWGEIAGVPRTSFEIALRSAGERARATIDATGDGVRAQLAATIHTVGDRLALDDATLHATIRDPARVTGGAAPVHGTLRIDLAARGAVRPEPSLAVTGAINGKNIRFNDLSVASLQVNIDAARLPNRPLGKARVELQDLVRGDMHLGQLMVNATDRADGKVAVSVRSQPKQNPWLIEADAVVTPPGKAGDGRVLVDLVRHRVRAAGGSDWTGTTGHLEVGPQRIALTDLKSASAIGRLAVAGSFERAGRRRGDVSAHVEATSLSLENLAGDYHGRVDAKVAVTRKNGAWDGELLVDAADVKLDPSPAVIAAQARGKIHGARLELAAEVSSAQLGAAELALDLDIPADVTDAAAWKRLGRSAIRTGRVALKAIDLKQTAELAGLTGYAGQVNGEMQISSSEVGGRVDVTGIVAPELRGLQGVSGAFALSQSSASELTPTLMVTAQGVGAATAQARLAIPERLFDPAAWRALGRGALRGATVTAKDIRVDPAMLDRLGVVSEFRGSVSLAAEVTEGAQSVRASVDVAGLRGAPIVQPIDVHFEAAIDNRATTSQLTVAAQGKPLLAMSGRLPLSLDRVLARGRTGAEVAERSRARGASAGQAAGNAFAAAIRATPLSASMKLDTIDAQRLLAVFGRSEITGGVIDGEIEVSGTLGKPTVKVELAATNLKVPPGPRGKPVRTVEKLTIKGGWDGTTAKLEVEGVESEGGKLQLAAVARPEALRDGKITVKATKFDLVPILAFLPGPAGGAAGTLDANLTFTGLDLRTTKIAGELHLSDARVPIAPQIGTLRRAKIDAVVGEREIKLNINGRLGGGDVVMTGAIALDGAAASGGNAKITLRKVSPIGVVEPQVTADITAKLTRDKNQWRADLVVDNASVKIPNDRGERLKPAGMPADMRFASGERPARKQLAEQAPSNPIFVLTLSLRSTRVESDEFRGLVKGKLELRADGDSLAVFGGVQADRGDIDLFGRRYYIERAGVNFDGSLDPRLDVRITHEFADLTTVTEVRGRASNPELVLSSDPGIYSQGQLLGFLLGGDPGGEGGGASDRVTDAGASLVANKIGGYIRDALPVDIDVLRYEAASATSSAAVLVGTWLTHSLFVAYRQHLEARPDENTGEGELEYWLSRRVVIEGTAGSRVNGVDLLWRKRY